MQSPIAKFLSETTLDSLKDLGGISDGDVMFFIAVKRKQLEKLAGMFVMNWVESRTYRSNVFKFCWIVDFPMYELDDDGKVEFSHNRSPCHKAEWMIY